MDLSTILGFALGLGLIAWSMMHGGGLSGLALFVHPPAFAVVFGGSLAAVMIHFRLEDVKGLFKIILRAFLYPIPTPTKEIDRIIEYTNLARKEGLLALESKLREVDDKFFAKGIQLVIDGFSADTVREILEVDAEVEKQRHASGKRMLEQFGTFAPAFGMVETLIGLVQMLSNLSDPSKIGAGMAGALVGTFYGALAANLIFLPMAGKLDVRAKQEYLLRELMIAGIIAIQSGEKPQLIKEKLKGFVPPAMRETVKS
ncbi:MAG TPA: motility protein A [Planctomycetota bacterium]|nr:motility protein A [Planctomycetota bacterium]